MNTLVLTRREVGPPRSAARQSAVHPRAAGSEPSAPGRVLLLEGEWDERDEAPERTSLDAAIDQRHAWIDRTAVELAERASLSSGPSMRPWEAGGRDDSQNGFTNLPTPGYLYALSLRYYLVQLLRVVAFFTSVEPLRRGDLVRLVAERGRDDDYADLIRQLAEQARARCRIDWRKAVVRPAPKRPPNRWWRRWLGHLATSAPGRTEAGHPSDCRQPPVILCGNPRVLDPVCGELVERGVPAWWLNDRFAVGTWRRWRRDGVGQLVCNASLGRHNAICLGGRPKLPCLGVDLGRAVHHWLQERVRRSGAAETHLLTRMEQYFRRLLPAALVLDEDATPFARAAVAMARRYGARTWVVQHGVTCCRFGFAPLAADGICVWGRSSCQQLLDWDVAIDRIHITGSPLHEIRSRTIQAERDEPAASNRRRLASSERRTKTGRPRILLLCTPPPKDSRPDSIALRLTGRGYASMLDWVMAAVAQLPGAELTMKLHPRAPGDPTALAAQAAYPGVKCRIVRRGKVESLLAEADCVLSCLSSAGVEVAAQGVPVIQLLPPGAGSVLPHAAWGMLGTAQSGPELVQLLHEVLRGQLRPIPGAAQSAFSHRERPAEARIVDCALGIRGTSAEPVSPSESEGAEQVPASMHQPAA